MFTKPEDTKVEYTDAQNNILELGARISAAVAEVGGQSPAAVAVMSELEGGARELKGGIAGVASASARLARAKDEYKRELPFLRQSILGVATSVRWDDPQLALTLLNDPPLLPDPMVFLDRCILEMEDNAQSFAPQLAMLARVRAHLHAKQVDVRQATADHAAAEKECRIASYSLSIAIHHGRSYVLKHAAHGSPVLDRLKGKGGRPKKARPVTKPASSQGEAVGGATLAVVEGVVTERAEPSAEEVVATNAVDMLGA